MGNYPRLVGRYYDRVEPTFNIRTYPHSLVLAAWAETGPVGLFGFLWAWSSVLWHGVRRLRDSDAGPSARVAAGTVVFVVAALGVVGLTHDVLFHNAVALAVASGVGMALPLLRVALDRPGPERVAHPSQRVGA